MTNQKTPKSILLVYEEIPERTAILLLNGADLAAASLSATDVASVHGTYVNSSELSNTQQEIQDKLNECIFGEWDEDTNTSKPALWKDKIIFQTDDEALSREGMPPEITGDTMVVHAGFVL